MLCTIHKSVQLCGWELNRVIYTNILSEWVALAAQNCKHKLTNIALLDNIGLDFPSKKYEFSCPSS